MADAVFKDCIEQIVTDIQALSLPGITTASDEIVGELKPWGQFRLDWPITVHPSKEDLRAGRGTCGKDDIGYGVQVSMIHSNVEAHATILENYTQWRQKIRDKFHNKRLSGVSTVFKCTVQLGVSYGHGQVGLPKEFIRDSYFGHALIIWCWSREARS